MHKFSYRFIGRHMRHSHNNGNKENQTVVENGNITFSPGRIIHENVKHRCELYDEVKYIKAQKRIERTCRPFGLREATQHL